MAAKKKSAPIKRYYAQHIDGAWRVFDREMLTEQGAAITICAAINSTQALRIRDALNMYHELGGAT